jgi:hypothetical protein
MGADERDQLVPFSITAGSRCDLAHGRAMRYVMAGIRALERDSLSCVWGLEMTGAPYEKAVESPRCHQQGCGCRHGLVNLSLGIGGSIEELAGWSRT